MWTVKPPEQDPLSTRSLLSAQVFYVFLLAVLRYWVAVFVALMLVSLGGQTPDLGSWVQEDDQSWHFPHHLFLLRGGILDDQEHFLFGKISRIFEMKVISDSEIGSCLVRDTRA